MGMDGAEQSLEMLTPSRPAQETSRPAHRLSLIEDLTERTRVENENSGAGLWKFLLASRNHIYLSGDKIWRL